MPKFYLRKEPETPEQRCYLKHEYGTDENIETKLELTTQAKYYLIRPLEISNVGYDTYTDYIGGEHKGWITGTEDILPQGNYYLDFSKVRLLWYGTGQPEDKASVCMYAKIYQVTPGTEEYTLIATANSGVCELSVATTSSHTFSIPFETNLEITDPNGRKLFISYNLYLVSTNLNFVRFYFSCETPNEYIEYVESLVTTRTVQNTLNLNGVITKVVVLDTRTVSNNLILSPQLSGIMTTNRLVEIGFNLAPTVITGGGGRSVATTLNLAGIVTRQSASHPDRTVYNTLNLSASLSRIGGVQRIVETDLGLSSTLERKESEIRDGAWEDALTDIEDGFEEAL